MLCSSVKLFIWSWEVELGPGDVNRKILIVRSSLAVAKYLLAGSNVMPLTWLWWFESVFNFSKVCPDQTTTFESSPTDTRIVPSYDHPRSCTSLSCPISLRNIRQFSTGGVSFVPKDAEWDGGVGSSMYIQTILSSAPDARYLPPGENRTVCIVPE